MTDSLGTLLAEMAAAWWRDIDAPDYVERVNTAYDAYLLAGGNDAHFDAHWRELSDAAKAKADVK